MSTLSLHDVVMRYGAQLRARILCDVWMYTDYPYRIERGDVVARIKGDGTPTYYTIEEVLVTNGEYQKFRVAKMPA